MSDVARLEIEALKELIVELVIFTAHDKSCAMDGNPYGTTPSLTIGLDDQVRYHSLVCTCGLNKVYDKVDRFIDD